MSTPIKPPGLHPLAWNFLLDWSDRVSTSEDTFLVWKFAGFPLEEEAKPSDPDQAALDQIDAWLRTQRDPIAAAASLATRPHVLQRLIFKNNPPSYNEAKRLVEKWVALRAIHTGEEQGKKG